MFRQTTNRVTSINDAGIMVGGYVDSSGISHGFMLKGGKTITIDDPNGSNGSCFDINTNGVIVGYYKHSDGTSQGFLYAGGKFTDAGPSGGQSQVSGINTQEHWSVKAHRLWGVCP